MPMINQILSAETLIGAGLVIALWIIGKGLDYLFEWALDRKIIAPIVDGAKWRIRALWTRANPIESGFEVSYTPRDDLTRREARSVVEDVFENVEESSHDRLSVDGVAWDGDTGKSQVTHIDGHYPYEVKVSLPPSSDDMRENPGVDSLERKISKIHVRIWFKFPFHAMDDVLSNLGTFASFLERSFKQTIRGTISDGQFIIDPVEGNLTLDEWIEQEGFEISVLLASEGKSKTEVEFFPDHAEVHPPYLEIDSETRRYIRLMILNYYLREG